MVIFNSYVSHYQRVSSFSPGENDVKWPFHWNLPTIGPGHEVLEAGEPGVRRGAPQGAPVALMNLWLMMVDLSMVTGG